MGGLNHSGGGEGRSSVHLPALVLQVTRSLQGAGTRAQIGRLGCQSQEPSSVTSVQRVKLVRKFLPNESMHMGVSVKQSRE